MGRPTHVYNSTGRETRVTAIAAARKQQVDTNATLRVTPVNIRAAFRNFSGAALAGCTHNPPNPIPS